LQLFVRTAGKELHGTEIDEAVLWCEVYGANPLLKDIYFFVFDAADPKKRRVVPVLSIQLYRKNADKCGNYRPDDKPPRFTYDDALAGPDNPRGILDCEVTVWKHAHGAWHPITERVRWDERAPIIEDGENVEWIDTGETWPDTGKPKKRKKVTGNVIRKLDPTKRNWLTMPETMLAKCTEAAAIRKGWPDATAGSYTDGELDAAHTIELTATEILTAEAEQSRLAKVNALDTIMVQWDPEGQFDRVPLGQMADRSLAWIGDSARTGKDLMTWRYRNEHSLKEFWARAKTDALAVKAALEDRIEHLALAGPSP
jgi:phage recombination protein Bet